MKWHYAIVKTGESYAVHEVYIEDGQKFPTSWTKDGEVAGETPEDVITQLTAMLEDAVKRQTYRVEGDKLVPDMP